MTFKLKSAFRTDNQCTGADSVCLTYSNNSNGIITEKHITIPTPKIIRFELELEEINQLNKSND
jgi:hypothetical protein